MKKNEWKRQALFEHQAMLVRYAAHMIGNSEVAKEIVQETLLRFIETAGAEVRDFVKPWLLRVCRNMCIDHLRKAGVRSDKQKELEHHLDGEAPGADTQLEGEENMSRVQVLLKGLSPQQQEVVRLKFQEDLSYKEISRLTGMPVNQVGVVVHTSLQKLKSLAAKENVKEGVFSED